MSDIMRVTLRAAGAFLSLGALALGCGAGDAHVIGGGDSAGIIASEAEAVTTLTLSGKVTSSTGAGLPGVTVTLAGSASTTRVTDTTGSYSFAGLAKGSYSLRATKASCAFTPDVVNLNNLTVSRTQNFTGAGAGCAAAARALMLIDSRLYAPLKAEVDTYRALAAQRRGFGIDFRSVNGLDDLGYAAVKSYVSAAKQQNPALEGVLYVGNVKLPSFYKVRNDVVLNRLYPTYLEDLDGVFEKRRTPGSSDPSCEQTSDPECVVGDARPVPEHDFDYFTKGASPNSELWAAFMPVGVAGSANGYGDFATQLRPYLNKLASYYRAELVSNHRLYFVSNDIGERPEWNWDAFGAANIDFYGKPGPNGETGDACLVGTQNLCYVRWPTENYPAYADFAAYFASFPWVAENWQQANVFIPHMNAALYDVVEVNTHASETWSIVDSNQARTLTKAGLLVALDGCSVAGFYQPGSPSTTDAPVLAGDNLAVSYLYGSSKALAALGDPNWRGHYANHPLIFRELKKNSSYLGLAHRTRMAENYSRAGSSAYDLKEWASELLLGDPFIDLR